MQSAHLEESIFNDAKKKPAEQGPWVYTGSETYPNGLWAAQAEGSIVATFTDPLAVFNNPRAGAKSDEIWIVAKNVPPVDTPVQVTLTPHQKAKQPNASE